MYVDSLDSSDLEEVESQLYSQIYYSNENEHEINVNLNQESMSQDYFKSRRRYFSKEEPKKNYYKNQQSQNFANEKSGQRKPIPKKNYSNYQEPEHSLPHFLVNPLNNFLVLPENSQAVITTTISNEGQKFKKKKKKMKKREYITLKPSPVKSSDSLVIELSDSDDDKSNTNPLRNDEDSSDEVIFVEQPPLESIVIEEEDANKQTTSPNSAKNIDIPQNLTTDSNDFLDNSNVDNPEFNFSLHGSEFQNAEFLKPNPVDDTRSETASSCSISDTSFVKATVFNEVDFPKGEDLFAEGTMDRFHNYITPLKKKTDQNLPTLSQINAQEEKNGSEHIIQKLVKEKEKLLNDSSSGKKKGGESAEKKKKNKNKVKDKALPESANNLGAVETSNDFVQRKKKKSKGTAESCIGNVSDSETAEKIEIERKKISIRTDLFSKEKSDIENAGKKKSKKSNTNYEENPTTEEEKSKTKRKRKKSGEFYSDDNKTQSEPETTKHDSKKKKKKNSESVEISQEINEEASAQSKSKKKHSTENPIELNIDNMEVEAPKKRKKKKSEGEPLQNEQESTVSVNKHKKKKHNSESVDNSTQETIKTNDENLIDAENKPKQAQSMAIQTDPPDSPEKVTPKPKTKPKMVEAGTQTFPEDLLTEPITNISNSHVIKAVQTEESLNENVTIDTVKDPIKVEKGQQINPEEIVSNIENNIPASNETSLTSNEVVKDKDVNISANIAEEKNILEEGTNTSKNLPDSNDLVADVKVESTETLQVSVATEAHVEENIIVKPVKTEPEKIEVALVTEPAVLPEENKPILNQPPVLSSVNLNDIPTTSKHSEVKLNSTEILKDIRDDESSDDEILEVISINSDSNESIIHLNEVKTDLAINCKRDKNLKVDSTSKVKSKEIDPKFFDLDAILKNMPDNPQLWAICDKDRRPEKSKTSPRCIICKEQFHVAQNCPKKYEYPKCYLCAGIGHEGKHCPNQFCMCGARYRTARCNRCISSKRSTCNICRVQGHNRDQCPDLWRRYHLTTKPGPVVKSRENKLKHRKYQWCSNCSQNYHLFHECVALPRKMQLSTIVPQIFEYASVLRDDQKTMIWHAKNADLEANTTLDNKNQLNNTENFKRNPCENKSKSKDVIIPETNLSSLEKNKNQQSNKENPKKKPCEIKNKSKDVTMPETNLSPLEKNKNQQNIKENSKKKPLENKLKDINMPETNLSSENNKVPITETLNKSFDETAHTFSSTNSIFKVATFSSNKEIPVTIEKQTENLENEQIFKDAPVISAVIDSEKSTIKEENLANDLDDNNPDSNNPSNSSGDTIEASKAPENAIESIDDDSPLKEIVDLGFIVVDSIDKTVDEEDPVVPTTETTDLQDINKKNEETVKEKPKKDISLPDYIPLESNSSKNDNEKPTIDFIFVNYSIPKLQNFIREDLKILQVQKFKVKSYYYRYKAYVSDSKKPQNEQAISVEKKQQFFKELNMLLFGKQGFKSGKEHLKKMEIFVKSIKTYMAPNERVALQYSYNMIFSNRLHDFFNYSYLLKILLDSYGTRGVI